MTAHAHAPTPVTFRRRPSAPYTNFTGYIILGSLGLMVLLAFVLPNGPTLVEQVAAQPAATAGVQIMPTGTARLPTPLPVVLEAAPTVNADTFTPAPFEPSPTTDTNWIPSPTPAPPESAPAIIVEGTPETIVVPAAPNVVYDTPVTIVVEASPVVVQNTPVVIYNTAAPEQHTPSSDGVVIIQPAPVVDPADFKEPDPNAKCQFVGCLKP